MACGRTGNELNTGTDHEGKAYGFPAIETLSCGHMTLLIDHLIRLSAVGILTGRQAVEE
jgi:hypothetical protein